MDFKPRKLSAEQFNVLTNFAELAVRQLEKDHLLQIQKLVRLSLADCCVSGRVQRAAA